MLRKSIFALTLGLFMTSGASANLIVGGGFNSEADLANWIDVSDGGGGISIAPCCSLAPQEGAGYLAFTGNSNSVATDWYGGAFQFVGGLTIGSTYEFSYYWAGRGGNVGSDAAASAGVTTGGFNSASIAGNLHAIANPIGIWTKETVTFIAQETAVFVDFSEISTNSRNRGAAIDNVSLVDIPVPGTLALLGLGLLGLSRRLPRS